MGPLYAKWERRGDVAYMPPDTSVPFVAERKPGEIDETLEAIEKEKIFYWLGREQLPSKLTDEMIAQAENELRAKLSV